MDYEAKEFDEADAALCRNPHGTVLCGRSALSLGLPRDPAIGRASLRASHPAKHRRHREGLDQRLPSVRAHQIVHTPEKSGTVVPEKHRVSEILPVSYKRGGVLRK